MAYSAIIRLTTSLDKDGILKIARKKCTRDVLEHVEAVSDEGERANSISW